MNRDLCRRLLPLAALMLFGFCFGDDIDRAIILIGLLFAALMAGGVPGGKTKGELDA